MSHRYCDAGGGQPKLTLTMLDYLQPSLTRRGFLPSWWELVQATSPKYGPKPMN
jgi:hypothetical protein